MSVIEWTEIKVHTGGVVLAGDIAVPEPASGIVVFAHGSGSSRFSQRNRRVAIELQKSGLGTMLFDLLTAEEEARDRDTASIRFDIELLAPRLIDTTHLLREREDLPIGYFGASTGAAIALMAAGHHPDDVAAVVSRGGRPDLAMSALPRVRAATLLIVGENDRRVVHYNQIALDYLQCEKRLAIVPGATHLFEEPGALEEVATLAADWFARHFAKVPVVA